MNEGKEIVKTSIIITTYNRSKLLKERSIISALNQSGTAWSFEVIIVDDCSTDDTEQVVKDFQAVVPGIVYVKHPKNYGVATARNTGIKHAKGEYIVFLDDDDFLANGFLMFSEVVLDNLKDKDVVIGARFVIYPDGAKYFETPDISKKPLYVALDDGFLIRKSVFEKIQYDENMLLNEDADFGLQFARTFGIDKICMMHNCFLIKWGHIVDSDDSMCAVSDRTYYGMKRYLEKNLKFYLEYNSKEELEYIYRMAGILFCQYGSMKEGISYLWKARKAVPTMCNTFLILCALGGQKFFRKRYKIYKTTDRHF